MYIENYPNRIIVPFLDRVLCIKGIYAKYYKQSVKEVKNVSFGQRCTCNYKWGSLAMKLQGLVAQ